jgi:hypothetical protein
MPPFEEVFLDPNENTTGLVSKKHPMSIVVYSLGQRAVLAADNFFDHQLFRSLRNQLFSCVGET